MFHKRQVVSLLSAAVTIGAAAAVHAQVAAGALTLGTPVSASLDASDATSSARTSSKMDRYTFRGTAGQTIQITMVSEAFDTYLYLFDANGLQLAYDDDGLGNLDSRIRHVLPSDGIYTVEATAFGGGLGEYTLLAEEFVPRGIAVQPISVGSTIQGTFSANDGESTYSGPAQAWEFEAEPGHRYEIRTSSAALAPTLSLVGPGGVSVGTGNYSSGDGSVVLGHTAAAGGTYRIVVTGGYSGAYGEYELSLRAVEATSGSAANLPLDTPTVGTLESGDATDMYGYMYDAYTLEAPAGRVVRVGLRSDDFDPAVTVVDANGQQICWNDDDGSGSLSATCSFATEAGMTYTVLAKTSYGGFGTYTLSASAQRPVEIEPRRIRVGQTIEGTLTSSDPLTHDGTGYVDVFSLEATAGQRIAVSLTSPEGARLRITSPSGGAVHEDYGYGIFPYGGMYEEPMYDERGMIVPSSGGSWTGTLTQSGVYLISVNGATAADATYTLTTAVGTPASEAPELPLGGAVTGRVSITDPVVAEIGAATDSYRFVVSEAGRYRIHVANSDPAQNWIPPTLAMRNNLAETSWGTADQTNPEAYLFSDLLPGTYTVLVSGYGSEFDYTVSATAMEATTITRTPIQPGTPVNGSLTATSPIAPDRAAPAAFYSLTLNPGETVSIAIASPTFAPTATLYNELGEWVNSTDANWGTPLEYTAAVPTTLTIVVGGYSMSDVGAFTLTVSR